MKKDKNKLIWDILTLVASLLMLALILLYWFRVIDFYDTIFFSIIAVTLYVICFFQTIILSSKHGQRKYKMQILAVAVPAILYSTLIIMSSEIFKSDRILTARVVREKYFYDLVFRENGDCEKDGPILLPLPQKAVLNKYQIVNDSLLIISNPDFRLDTLLIDRNDNALFLHKDSLGIFIRFKDIDPLSLYHYDIIE